MLHPIAIPLEIALLAIAGMAACFDVATRRIPNWLSLGGCVAGLAINTFLSGWGGLRGAGFGLGAGFALYFPLWLLGARGAGDVKLLAAAGSLVGPANTLQLFLLAALAGGVLALALVVSRGAVRGTFWNIREILWSLMRFQRPNYTLSSPGALRLPHGLVIFLAAAAEIVILNGIRNG